MPRLDELPPDLRATLSLLVDRGKSYAEVAELLGISEAAVRDRAHAALDRLAGATSAASAGGMQEGVASSGVTPAGATPSGAAPTGAAAAPPSPARPAAPSGTGGGVDTGGRAGASARGRAEGGRPVSRRGGAILLAGLVAVIVAVVVLVSSGGSGTSTGKSAHKASTHTTATGATSAKSGKTPAVTSQLTLTATEPGSKAIGLAEVLAEGSQHAIIVAAEHLAPSNGFYYLVWLYNSPTNATPIGRAPTVGSNGRLQGGALLPSDAGAYEHILITRETSSRPSKPGPAVLEGKFSLSS